MSKNLSKKLIYISMLMVLGFLFTFIKESVSYASGASEETASNSDTTGSSSSSSSSSSSDSVPGQVTVNGITFALAEADELKKKIDGFFTTPNPNSSEKVVKSINMELKEATGMKIEMVFDRNLLNKMINGQYVYQLEDSSIVNFKQESSSVENQILITKETLNQLNKYLLSKIFAFDKTTKNFKVLNMSLEEYKGLYTYVKSIQIHDDPAVSDFSSQEAINSSIAQYFIELEGSPKIMPISQENIETLFEVNWKFRKNEASAEQPALLGYYTRGAIADNRSINTIIRNVFSLEHVYYPAYNGNDGSDGLATINGSLFPKELFIGNAVNSDSPFLHIEAAIQGLLPVIVELYLNNIAENLEQQYTINSTDDVTFNFTISPEEMIKSFGASEKYKGTKPKV